MPDGSVKDGIGAARRRKEDKRYLTGSGRHTDDINRPGQLVTASCMDYCMPRADDLPSFKVDYTVTACTHNDLGVKGCGEAGAIAAPPALINAVIDALSPLGVTDMSMPASPEKVWRAINDAQAEAAE